MIRILREAWQDDKVSVVLFGLAGLCIGLCVILLPVALWEALH